MVPEESYFTTNGVTDMFQPRVFDLAFIAAHCSQVWGVTPRPEWISVAYGSPAGWGAAGVSNIAFSNGLYDPWSSGGVVVSFWPGGGHRAKRFSAGVALLHLRLPPPDPDSFLPPPQTNLSASLPAIIIPEGAHHIDTFFADPQDPPSVKMARQTEMRLARQWIAEWYAARGGSTV